MHFQFHQKVLFKHCDPAGIIFYPRFFEIVNDAVEAMFSELFDWPFEDLLQDGGVPTVSFNVEFRAPSRHGEHLDLNLTIKSMGGSSMAIQTVAVAGDEIRVVVDQVIVRVNESGRSAPWPDSLQIIVNALMEGPK